MYRLFGARGSGAAMIEMALAEADAPYEFVGTGLGKGGKDEDSFLRVNPTGKVPALQTPEGDVLTESAAILVALAERHSEAKLLPGIRTRKERATAIRWLVYIAAEIYSMIEIEDYPSRFVSAEPAQKDLREHVRERIRRRWLAVESAVAGNPWLLKRGFSVADLAIATVSRWTTGKRWRKQRTPRIEALAAAVAERKAAGPVWHRHFG